MLLRVDLGGVHSVTRNNRGESGIGIICVLISFRLCLFIEFKKTVKANNLTRRTKAYSVVIISHFNRSALKLG